MDAIIAIAAAPVAVYISSVVEDILPRLSQLRRFVSFCFDLFNNVG